MVSLEERVCRHPTTSDRLPCAETPALRIESMKVAALAALDDDLLSTPRRRGLKVLEETLGSEGGTWPTSLVAKHLLISRQAVDRRRRSGKLIALNRLRRGDVDDVVMAARGYGRHGAA